jgi:hypothetical protein
LARRPSEGGQSWRQLKFEEQRSWEGASNASARDDEAKATSFRFYDRAF